MAAASYLSFGQYLTHFMDRRGYSGVALAQLLGEKSATLISRIKADQCTPSRCEAFLRQLSDALGDLTEDELLHFRRGLIILRHGMDAYCAYRAIHQLFTRTPALPPVQGTLHTLLQPPADADAYDVICMQCSEPVVTDELTALCRSFSGRLSIRHYVTFPLQSTTAQLIASLLPILCDARYSLTEFRFPGGNPSLGISAQRFIATRCIRGQQAEYQLLLPCCDGSALQLSSADGSGYERCLQFIDALDCTRIPLSRRYPMESPVNVLAFLDMLVQRERDHASCLFKRDFCFSFIPLDVMQSAFNDVLLHLPPAYSRSVTELRRLCYMRHRSVCNTAKPIRMLLSRSGVQRFLQTGLLGDHFYGLRAFTMDERKRVLAHMIELIETNPNITLHFARDESIYQSHDFFIFEHGCAVITSAADRRPSAHNADLYNYREAVLSDPSLVEQLARYFDQYLLAEKAYTAEESIAQLQELLSRMP